MPRNGSGTYTLPAGNPVVTGTIISSTTQNTTMSDVATALTNSIAKDGQTVPTANLPMGGFKHTGAADATATGQYLTYGQDGTVLGNTTIDGTLTMDETATMNASTMIWAKGADVASAATLPLVADGNYFDVTGTTTITSFASLGVGTWIGLHFDGILTLTHSADLVLPTGANITTAAGDEAIFVEYASGDWRCVSYTRASGEALVSTSVVQNYISGLTLSTAGASTTMTIAAGVAADSTNAVMMTLASAINKTTASWAVGDAQGGLDTGTIANNTWYHFYEIRRPDTGVVDVVFSINASTPTLPANYTQFRRIGSGLTNGSAQWVLFKQFGNEFYWDAVVVDANAANPGTSAVTRTITVPTGVQVLANISVGLYSGTNNLVAYVSSLDQSDQASVVWNNIVLTNLGATESAVTPGGAGWGWSTTSVLTNTSAQIRTRNGSSGANDRIAIITNGWTDSRGAQ